ncbi:hypothetical protein DAEQUDRAFT_769438 [Daedalea quercina L-15889]|uniref:Uncharacterized protein n=1 Tax=Daedalea quercina L-15889 TaxID=1314783 RepID=A0A165LQB1_9APHY|nr:hypothetical protein DAEQUDRAFT_769438 [Daedalea quercina L-15889]
MYLMCPTIHGKDPWHSLHKQAPHLQSITGSICTPGDNGDLQNLRKILDLIENDLKEAPRSFALLHDTDSIYQGSPVTTDYRVEVEPIAYGLPALDDLFWNDDLRLFEIKSTSAGLDQYDPVLVQKATKDDAPTWNYLNNELKAAQTLTKKFLDSRRRISERIQEIHEQRPVKDTPATIQ